jgi:hypothetical protein
MLFIGFLIKAMLREVNKFASAYSTKSSPDPELPHIRRSNSGLKWAYSPILLEKYGPVAVIPLCL